jgi:hypothetical protein
MGGGGTKPTVGITKFNLRKSELKKGMWFICSPFLNSNPIFLFFHLQLRSQKETIFRKKKY